MILTNANILDVTSGELLADRHIVVEDGRIVEIVEGQAPGHEHFINVAGAVVMPGLIDCHVHAIITTMDLAAWTRRPVMVLAQETRLVLEGMLQRGFTTVRDCGGADYGLADAVERGLINGPRILYSGRVLTQTGGHADFRSRSEDSHLCGCQILSNRFAHIADGVPAVRKAAREELRLGAHQLKIMASGGVASPTDPVWSVQYSPEEMRAIVEEATDWRTYATAHAYTPEAIRRAVEAGVRSIEHGNLIDAPTAALMKERGTYLVPTLVTYYAMAEMGEQLKLPEVSRRKVHDVLDSGLASLELAKAAGVPMAFGTDLLGETHNMQLREFALRAEVLSPLEVIQSATTTAAELIGRIGELGVIAPGARADLLVLDGSPLEDLSVLSGHGEHVKMVLKDGQVVVRQ